MYYGAARHARQTRNSDLDVGATAPAGFKLAYATINGDMVTVHNIRNFDYRTETDFTPAYDDGRGLLLGQGLLQAVRALLRGGRRA